MRYNRADIKNDLFAMRVERKIDEFAPKVSRLIGKPVNMCLVAISSQPISFVQVVALIKLAMRRGISKQY